jgi:hypothetical protein
MATTMNIELYDVWRPDDREGFEWQKRAILYYWSPGCAARVAQKLERTLEAAIAEMDKVPFTWGTEAETMGALIVSSWVEENRVEGSAPTILPCFEVQIAVEYLWRVFLGPKHGEYRIECFSVTWDSDVWEIDRLEKVDWEEEPKW